MSELSVILSVIGLISGWELIKRGIIKLYSHRHKWVDLGEDYMQWSIHLELNVGAAAAEQLAPILRTYDVGQYCLRCKSYSFEMLNDKGQITQKLGFHQSNWGSA